MIHDNLPKGIRNHVRTSIAELETLARPIEDTLDTLKHLARPLFIGLDNDAQALDHLIAELKRRWLYYEANDAWAGSAEIAQEMLPKATAKRTNNATPSEDEVNREKVVS